LSFLSLTDVGGRLRRLAIGPLHESERHRVAVLGLRAHRLLERIARHRCTKIAIAHKGKTCCSPIRHWVAARKKKKKSKKKKRNGAKVVSKEKDNEKKFE
jgi:hypothetical protein